MRSWELRGLRTSNYSSPEKVGRRFYFDGRMGITWFSGAAERGLRTSNYSSPEKGGRRFYFDGRMGITWFSGAAERGSVVTCRV